MREISLFLEEGKTNLGQKGKDVQKSLNLFLGNEKSLYLKNEVTFVLSKNNSGEKAEVKKT